MTEKPDIYDRFIAELTARRAVDWSRFLRLVALVTASILIGRALS